ncbi:MAG: uroporphyrinogen decarboxylase [Candidatus Krumholzibacteria bacterium]|nr:uroporphyrinogen decarboxylase [Candidatus Krumholzibacteria bacterium]
MSEKEPKPVFLRACRRLRVDHTPIWLMRQAGRYMPEYRATRAEHEMLEVIRTPELAAEITLQPIERFGFDAAIIFADILPPLIGMGFDLEFVKGVGPRIKNPIGHPQDVGSLTTPPADVSMPGTLRAIKMVSDELNPRGIPLIGFCGAPFTLASYAIEGGGSRDYTKVKSFIYHEPDAWTMLMNKLVQVQADYLLAQAEAGASALQIFDSWVGLALGAQDYKRYVQPYNTTLFAKVARGGVPVINFSTGTGAYIEEVARCGGDVVGIDWRLPLDEAWHRIGHERSIQGNLDPAALLAPWPELKLRVDDVLARAGGNPGHIFNLGHGIFPQTSVDQVQRLVDYVREMSARRGARAQ